MSGGGGWLGSDGEPSPDLEARWGPRTPAAPAESPAGPVALQGPPIVPAPSAGPRRRTIVASMVIVVVAAVLGVVAVLASAGGGSGGGERTVRAASRSSSPTIDESLRQSARAFGERWSAGPSTTMPLGAAGVPPEQRPTTTTTPPPVRRQQPGSGSTLGRDPGSAGGVEGKDPYVEEEDPYLEEEWSEPAPEPEEAPKLAPDDPRLRGAEAAAQAFVDAVMRRDCDAAWSMLSTPTLELFASLEAAGEPPVKEEFCASLAQDEIPQIAVIPPARPYGDGALVDTEAEGEVDPLPMLLEGERWTVDLLA